MTKRATLVVVLAAASRQIATSLQSTSQPKPVTPMTMTERDIIDGKLEVHRMTAIRSDGAIAKLSLKTGKDNTGKEARSTLLPAEQKHIVIVDATKAKSTYYLEPQVVTTAKTVPTSPKCEQVREGATLTGEGIVILGYRTWEYTDTQQMHGSMRRHRVWLAPDLDCRSLRFLLEDLDAAGAVAGSFETAAMTVTVGEPDSNLFTDPADYREVPPSQAQRELRAYASGKALGPDGDDRLRPGMDQMDVRYRESQKYKPHTP
jgi:hypothetical protein